jgi:hypothetical protein
LNAASVVGARFGAELLAALGIDAVVDEAAQRGAHRSGAVHPTAEYAFRHPLIRAVAYESQLSVNREQTIARWPPPLRHATAAPADENAAADRHTLWRRRRTGQSCRWHLRGGMASASRSPAARAQWENA